jgi:hypothetical protein
LHQNCAKVGVEPFFLYPHPTHARVDLPLSTA